MGRIHHNSGGDWDASEYVVQAPKELEAANDTKTKSDNVEKKDYAPAGTIPDAHHLYEGKPDRRGRATWTTTYPDDLEEPTENAESAQYALLVRNKKSYDGRKKLEIHSAVVQSAALKELLGGVLKDYPGINTKLERVEFHAPFQPFVHRWDKFSKARAGVKDEETKTHVDLLWNLLEAELRDTIREKLDHVAHGVVRFDNIWTIFEPGVLIFSRSEDHDRIYKLTNGSFAATQCGRIYRLNCQYLDFDGENFGYGSEAIAIPEFSGTAKITKLRAFPLEHHPDIDAIKERLLARGRLFEKYKGYHFKAYDGIATGQGCWGPVRFSVNSRVILDTHAFNRFNPNRKVHLTGMGSTSSTKNGAWDSDSDYDYDDMDEIETISKKDKDIAITYLTQHQLLIATPTLRGYSLKDKKWLDFYIDNIREIVWNEEAFASLVAPPDQKELILAFAQSQLQNRSHFDDVIQGKGKGIIMLLSGPPGVGKTLTAESVAETMKAPLYMMSAGDLGTDPSDVETSLSNILEMNTKWNAVLLLDEADVFLEARSAHDLERNKLVSIFLRLLEYYEGVLFLTTNRVDNIDAAFESRIHLSLQYDELDKVSRRHVWETFLSRASTSGPRSPHSGANGHGIISFSEEDLDKLSERPMNGRQIKNVLKTSQLLASKQGVTLAFGHVDTVLRLRERHAEARKRSAEEVE